MQHPQSCIPDQLLWEYSVAENVQHAEEMKEGKSAVPILQIYRITSCQDRERIQPRINLQKLPLLPWCPTRKDSCPVSGC